MNKINLSIDLLKLQGAKRMTSKSGRDIVVIDIAESRAKPHQNGAVYFELDIIENKDGPSQYGQTHFVKEPTLNAERDGGMQFPIIGNGKEWRSDGQRQQSRNEPPPPARYQGKPAPAADDDDSEILF